MNFRVIQEGIAERLSLVGQNATVLLFAVVALLAIMAIWLDWAVPGIKDSSPVWAGVLVLVFGAGGPLCIARFFVLASSWAN